MLNHVVIEAIAYELAPLRITSIDIEAQLKGLLDRLGIPLGQLEALTGIRERRFWAPGVKTSDAATLAARKIFGLVDIDPKEVGCLINTSVSKDYVEPAVACFVHRNLNLAPHCLNFDIGNACLAFLNAIDLVSMMIESGKIRYGLVVAGENSRDVVEATVRRLQAPTATLQTFRDSIATLTLGSGAVAMLLCHKNVSRSGHPIQGSVSLAATQHNQLCLGQWDEMKTDAVNLLKAGAELAKQTWHLASQTLAGWADETIDLYAPHQVSTRNTMAITKALDITSNKVHLTLYTQGNTGPVAMPMTLAMAAEEGRLQSGNHVAMIGIGSGLNCSMMSVTW